MHCFKATIIFSASSGFARWTFIPASRLLIMSSAKAFADIAMIGTLLASLLFISLIVLALSLIHI